LNASSAPASLPVGQVLLASGPLPPSDDVLPPDTAIWLTER
jgi:hypothetical protein